MKTMIIDPVTRLEGHLRVEVDIDEDGGQSVVVDARASGTMFRGFERILIGRTPWDAPYLTQRVCGVCPISHAVASTSALDACGDLQVPENGRTLRNIVQAAEFVHSHLLHFYQLGLLDYVEGPDRLPFRPHWGSDRRIAGTAAEPYIANYVEALNVRRKTHELGALFSGRLPHSPAYIPGGFTGTPREERIAEAKQRLAEILSFVRGTWRDDVESIAEAYSDFLRVGRGRGNLLAFGGLPLGADDTVFKAGVVRDGAMQIDPFEEKSILEHVDTSWFDGGAAHPSQADTLAAYPKGAAYSWIKAPRYTGEAFEVGALARLWVLGKYRRGISTLDRYRARHQEAELLLEEMKGWLEELDASEPVAVDPVLPDAGSASGLTEAARGALGHWVELEAGKLSRYQIVTPTCWNASPRDEDGALGPLEHALKGTVVVNPDEPIEVLRVVHSFDPCLACAVHVGRPGAATRVRVLSTAR
jgi:hydrogenase large subunit